MSNTLLIIGGASSYAPGLIKAIITNYEITKISSIRLYDINKEKLAIVVKLTQKMALAAGVPLTIKGETQLETAIEGASIILNSSRPGGFSQRRNDELIPLAYGIPGQETVGPGGFLFAMRSVPEALRIARIVELQAKDAWFINYTNPTNIITEALSKYTKVKVIGLCDQIYEDMDVIGKVQGKAISLADVTCIGLNHATWYKGVLKGSLDFLDVKDWCQKHGLSEDYANRYAYCAKLATQDYWPNSYLPYYYFARKFHQLMIKNGPRSEEIIKLLPFYYQHFKEEGEKERPVLQHFRGSGEFGDLAVRVIAALSSKTPCELVLNIPNFGITDFFAQDTVVEAKVAISQDGIMRKKAPPPPAQSQALLSELESYQIHAAKALVGEASLESALRLNPLVLDRKIAQLILQEGTKSTSYKGKDAVI